MGMPTTEPVEERIVVDIQTALENISTRDPTTSYWNDVREINRLDGGWPSGDATPALFISLDSNDTADNLDEDQHALNEEELRITVHGILEEHNGPSVHLIRFARDIRTAVMLDPTRSALAEHTFIGQTQYAHGDENQPIAHVAVEVRVQYRTNPAALETVIT